MPSVASGVRRCQSSAASNPAEVAGSFVLADSGVPARLGTLVHFPRTRSHRQQTHFGTTVSSAGMESATTGSAAGLSALEVTSRFPPGVAATGALELATAHP